MTTVLNIRYKLLCAALVGALILQSCDDEEVYDVRGATQNKVYVNTQSWAPVSAPRNSTPFTVINTPIGSVINNADKVEVKFPVQCTHPARTDVRVSFAIDNALVTGDFSAIPAAVPVALNNAEVIIPAGATSSTDSVSVSIETAHLELLAPGTYMIPVKITSASNADVSSNLMAAFVLINTSESNIKSLAVADDVEGTLLTKTGWSGTVSKPLASGNAANMFTTSTTQYWRVDPGDNTFHFEVDMVSEQSNLTGIRLHTNNQNYNIVRLSVESSLDGENWTSQGQGELSLGTYQYVKFYKPVDARYFRITVLQRRHA
ncbi:MAG TPA: DUF1735 domain-containing protein, partial [Chryseosolibacter sp.]